MGNREKWINDNITKAFDTAVSELFPNKMIILSYNFHT